MQRGSWITRSGKSICRNHSARVCRIARQPWLLIAQTHDGVCPVGEQIEGRALFPSRILPAGCRIIRALRGSRQPRERARFVEPLAVYPGSLQAWIRRYADTSRNLIEREYDKVSSRRASATGIGWCEELRRESTFFSQPCCPVNL
jgi:hypothetical protein